jgi:hydroxymethylbilane synthase
LTNNSQQSRRSIRVGTRESKLALFQTNLTVARLKESFPKLQFEICPVTTHGDKVRDKPLFELGGRGVFVKELEEALLADDVDLVVHSLKDLPTDMPDGLLLAAVFDRTDPRDALISHNKLSLKDLPAGSRIATSSRRRSAQIAALRNDLTFVDIRGNIDTRLRKHAEGQCDAMILAAAGLARLNLTEHVSEFIDTEISLPAVGQAALAIESRSSDIFVCDMLKHIDDKNVRAEITAERAFLHKMGGGCSVPIGGLARLTERPNGASLSLTGCVCAIDGSKILRETQGIELTNDYINAATKLGQDLAEQMLSQGAKELLESFAQTPPLVSPP